MNMYIIHILNICSFDFSLCISQRQIGNWSADVCEPHLATGSQTFPFLAWFCSLPRTGKALVLIIIWLDVKNVMAWKRSDKGKIQFPVAVCGSKTSVLKFPNFSIKTLKPCWSFPLFSLPVCLAKWGHKEKWDAGLCKWFSWWCHFTTTTRILFGFPFLYKFCNPSEV